MNCQKEVPIVPESKDGSKEDTFRSIILYYVPCLLVIFDFYPFISSAKGRKPEESPNFERKENFPNFERLLGAQSELDSIDYSTVYSLGISGTIYFS